MIKEIEITTPSDGNITTCKSFFVSDKMLGLGFQVTDNELQENSDFLLHSLHIKKIREVFEGYFQQGFNLPIILVIEMEYRFIIKYEIEEIDVYVVDELGHDIKINTLQKKVIFNSIPKFEKENK